MSGVLYLSAAGIVLSVYALYVKQRAAGSKTYKPLCDVNKYISCTTAFGSKYGSIAVLPNPFYGIIIYGLLILLDYLNSYLLMTLLSFGCVVGSVWLAYVSYVTQKNFCLVCTTIYLINIAIFVLSVRMLG